MCACIRNVRWPEQPAKDASRIYHVVISKATMMSSFRTSEVKEMETIFKNSVSKSTRDTSMMAAPASVRDVSGNGLSGVDQSWGRP